MVGEETSDEERAELRETLGLMDPIHVQFSRFVVNASKGEFGISYQLKRPVSELIVEKKTTEQLEKEIKEEVPREKKAKSKIS